MYDEDGCLALAGAVIRAALRTRGPSWLLLPSGRWWCEMVGLSPEKLYRQAVEACNQWADESAQRAVAQLRRQRAKYGWSRYNDS